MRNGFTTGSCAAAASKAAAWMLFSGQEKTEITIMTPKGVPYTAAIEEISRDKGMVSCAVRKDGGDDPDITTGSLVFAEVRVAEDEVNITSNHKTGDADTSENRSVKISSQSSGLLQSEATLDNPDVGISKERVVKNVSDNKTGRVDTKARILIDGGLGVGRVTRPGLDQPIGSAAINHVPREMIEKEVREVCALFDFTGTLMITISVPDGIKLAKRTFNPRLGIEGGISILGTSGVVEPMSAQALLDTIKAELSVLSSEGRKICAISPGNYGQDYMREAYGFDLDAAVKCSNFIGDTMEFVAEYGFTHILMCGHIGKFIKLYGGVFNTHSHEGDCRMELMASAALRVGADAECARRILGQISTSAGLTILKDAGLLEKTMEEVLRGVMDTLNRWALERYKVDCIIYENDFGELARSEGAKELVEKLVRGDKEENSEKQAEVNITLGRDIADKSSELNNTDSSNTKETLQSISEGNLNQNKAGIICFTKDGLNMAERIAGILGDASVYVKSKAFTPEAGIHVKEPLTAWVSERFAARAPIIFIGAIGIAVRGIAPSVENKLTDSPVIVVDEKGRYVIPLLSGHYGGGIELSRKIAEGLGGEAIVTTATDTRGLFAVDVFARQNGLVISKKDGIKQVSSKLLEQGSITMLIDGGSILGDVPEEVRLLETDESVDVLVSARAAAPEALLTLHPKALHLGIGCRKGVPADRIRKAVEEVLSEYGYAKAAVAAVASADLKAEEPGLIEFARELGVPFTTYSAEELEAVPGEFTKSDFVRSKAGVDNVCERSAVRSSGNGKLLVRKQAKEGVTVAVAEAAWSVKFT